MSMLRALGILGHGLSGYATGQREFNDEERRKQNQMWLDEERGRQRQQWQEQDLYKSEMQAAATPTPIEATPGPDSSGNFARQDRGQPAEAPPMAYNVGGQAYSDRGMADAAGERARSKRVMDVVARRDPFKAEQLKTEQLQGRAAELQLSEAEKKTVREEHSRHVWEKLMESSGGKPSQQDIEAAFMVSNAPISEVLKYRADREDKAATQKVAQQNADSIEQSRKDTAAYHTGMLGVARTNAARDRQKAPTLTEQMAEIEKVVGRPLTQEEKLAKFGVTSKKGASSYDRMSESDKLTFQDINKQRETVNTAIVKAQAEGMWEEKGDNAKLLKTRMNVLNMQAEDLLKRYDKEGGSAPDPAKFRDTETKPAAPNKVPPPVVVSPTPAVAPTAAAPAPAMQQAAAPSPRALMAQRQESIVKAKADPEVQALNAQIAAAKTPRAAMPLNIQLNKLLEQRYGL